MDSPSLPREIQSSLFGLLKLEEVRIPGFYAFNYSATWSPPVREPFMVVFNPQGQDPCEWKAVLTRAESRAQDILQYEHSILMTGEKVFRRLFRNYKISPKEIKQIIPFLKLSMIKLVEAESDELVYPPCPPFPSFDLNVRIDQDLRVTEASFEG